MFSFQTFVCICIIFPNLLVPSLSFSLSVSLSAASFRVVFYFIQKFTRATRQLFTNRKMPPKKANGFMMFVNEWRNSNSEGRRMTITQAVDHCGKLWSVS